MLEFKTVEAEVIRLNLILVNWSIKDTDEPIGNFRFTVERSNSPEGPFITISPELTNEFQFFDSTIQGRSKFRKFYYRIKVKNVQDGKTLESDVANLDSAPDFFLLEIRRRNDLYLRRFVGVPAAVLVARTFGNRCAECYDQVKQRQRSSQCRVCFNRGFVGGYFNQINTFVNFTPNPEMVQLLDIGETQPVQSQMWMSSFPLLSPRDMIVEFPVRAEQRRWRVVSVGKTERLRATSRQIAGVTEINQNDIEYELPVEKFIPPEDRFLGFRPSNGSALL